MAAMGNSKQRLTRLAATVLDRTATAMMMVVEMARRKDDLPSVEVEPGVCQFDCPICKCNCQATFHENKRHTIANGLEKSVKQQTKPSETCKSLNKGGRSLYFNYVKNVLKNTSVRELQDVDYRSKDEQANDAITTIAINVLGSSRLQADPHVMCGLQEIVPGIARMSQLPMVAHR
jgi:hypothetical protein